MQTKFVKALTVASFVATAFSATSTFAADKIIKIDGSSTVYPITEAVAEEFHVVIGPVVDKLMRARPLGWYGVAGWNLYRQEALYRVETSSSIDYV